METKARKSEICERTSWGGVAVTWARGYHYGHDAHTPSPFSVADVVRGWCDWRRCDAMMRRNDVDGLQISFEIVCPLCVMFLFSRPAPLKFEARRRTQFNRGEQPEWSRAVKHVHPFPRWDSAVHLAYETIAVWLPANESILPGETQSDAMLVSGSRPELVAGQESTYVAVSTECKQ